MTTRHGSTRWKLVAVNIQSRKIRRVSQRGTRGAQPAAAASDGVIYHVTDESVVERSDGTRWEEVTSAVVVGVHTLLDGYVHSDVAQATAARGSLVYGNSSAQWDRLAVGAANRVLRSDGTDVSWGPVALTTDVSGDLPLANLAPSASASRLLGRGSASAGDWQEITLGAGITLSGTEISVTASGAGDMLGPASSTDNAVTRFNGATGKSVQNSGVLIDDSNNVTGVAALTASGQIAGSNGSAATPAFAPSADANTGLYFDGSDGAFVATGGTKRLTVSSAGDVYLEATKKLYLDSGVNTYLTEVSSDTVAVVTGGTQRFTVDTASVTSTLPWLGPNGSAGSPALAPSSDTNTGMFFNGGDSLSLSTGGTSRVQLTTGVLAIDSSIDTQFLGTADFAARVDFNHIWTWTSAISASFSGTQNNYNPTGLASAAIVRLDGSSSPILTGLTATINGEVKLLMNVGSVSITLNHESGSSTAAFRFLCPTSSSFTLTVNKSCYVWYDPTSGRWRVIG